MVCVPLCSFTRNSNSQMSKVGPTKEGFDKLLRWLDPDRDTAGEIYARIEIRVIRIFSSRGCCDAEDLADKTYNVVITKIDWLTENYVGDPALYFYAVAKKIYLESLRKKRPLPVPPPPDPEPEKVVEMRDYLDDCLDELSSADRDIAIRYHEGEKGEKIKNRQKLAEELDISRNALRIKVYYLHTRLRDCIERLQRSATRK